MPGVYFMTDGFKFRIMDAWSEEGLCNRVIMYPSRAIKFEPNLLPRKRYLMLKLGI